jgi:type I restriction enzyme S subunit
MITIDRRSWKSITLGEVAIEYSKRIENPSKSGSDKFIGSENIGRFDYSIKNWQSSNDVISAMKKFEIGDYLLVRRSLYASDFRERAPKANIEGLCSGDILTIKERKDKIADNFLYCVLNSSDIWKYIVKNASGSITRRIKWKELSEFIFNLPPLNEQKKIASLFHSIEISIDQVEGQVKNLNMLQKSLINGLLGPQPVFGNLLKDKNLHLFKFGNIAECDKRNRDQQIEIRRFIGLENIETNNFQLQGWGDFSNGTTFTKRFTTGDVLFGKRRAYLKKVAIADFDGVCSGDILVIRAKDNKILQQLLPFYISSDVFIQHAISTSAGSLSPRTKWKDLAELEVSIPDLKTQEKILEVLLQFETTITQLKQQKTTLQQLKQKLLSEILG